MSSSSSQGQPKVTASNSLRPFDLSGLGMGFGVYRPRRPSYTFATQEYRNRNESYRCATRKDHLDSNVSDTPSANYDECADDVISHRRKTSYIKATKNTSSLPSGDNNITQQTPKKCIATKNNIGRRASNLKLNTETEHHELSTKQTRVTLPPEDDTNPDQDYDLDLDLRCNRNRNSLSRGGKNGNKFDALRDGGSHEDISLTEVTLIQTVPLRSDVELNGGLMTGDHMTSLTTTNTNNQSSSRNNHNHHNHNNRKSLLTNTNTNTIGSSTTTASAVGGGGGGVRKSLSSTLRFNKNLIVLTTCFILIYSSFQAIQNLQSSVNTAHNLGPLAMMVVHIATVFSCLIAPTVINILSAKWALCLGVLFFLTWFGAHSHPTFYTLVPASILIGLAQGVVWSAESAYIHKLALDWSKISRASVDDETFRFHGIFLACFQTTHIWGNLISSLWLYHRGIELSVEKTKAAAMFSGAMMPPAMYDGAFSMNTTSLEGGGAYPADYVPMEGEAYLDLSKCGALSQCEGPPPRLYPMLWVTDPLTGVLWKLMVFYIVFGVIALLLVVCFLDRIGARANPGRSPKQVIIQHTSQLVTHPTLRLLTPLLLFNGIQQGFMYLDYNQYFVTCSLGVHYVGYCMITLGVANVLGAVFVTLFAHRIPREMILGFGGVLHIALMIGYLIWIPEDKPVLFCVLAGAWGLCDAIWQTQCNTLICLTCVEEPEVAFTNYRLVQSIGLALVFGMSVWACVSVKLYLLIVLLVVAIMFYVLAEYQLRHNDDDDVFEP